MPTVQELREQAKSYGLKGYSTLRKPGLIRLIAEARAPVLFERAGRAWKTGRYPALTRGDVDNPHKKAQRLRELHKLDDEVTAALRANKYAQIIKVQPRQRLKPLRQLSHRLKWLTHHWVDKEPLASKIIRKGPKLLEEIIPKDSEAKGRRTITWKVFRGLAGSVVDMIMTKVEALQTPFYLRFTYTYQLRHIETGKVILFSPNIAGVPTGSPCLLRTHAAAKEWLTEKDAMRLDMANLPRPNTKWRFQRWVQVEVKAILVEQLLLVQGLLPDWLRNKRDLYALDTFDDNMCLFRCIAAPWSKTRPLYKRGYRTGETILVADQRPAGTGLTRRGVHRT